MPLSTNETKQNESERDREGKRDRERVFRFQCTVKLKPFHKNEITKTN